jgi:hypothetical protein
LQAEYWTLYPLETATSRCLEPVHQENKDRQYQYFRYEVSPGGYEVFHS